MKVVLATGNAGKLREMRTLLSPLCMQILPQSELTVTDAIEDGLSFVENAIIKARNAALHSGLPAIADDSGLEVDALKGAPGIFSARFAGEHGNDAANNAKLLAELAPFKHEQRRARFRCVMVFMRHANDPSPVIGEGSWEGSIGQQADGDNGFGYDPLFYVASHGCTAARLGTAEKNTLSHRGQASRAMLKQLRYFTLSAQETTDVQNRQ